MLRFCIVNVVVLALSFLGVLGELIWSQRVLNNPISFMFIFQVLIAIALLIALIHEIKRGFRIYNSNKTSKAK